MAAEVVKYFFPKLVDLHNYVSANSTQQKLSNWNLLNRQDITVLCVCVCVFDSSESGGLNDYIPAREKHSPQLKNITF